MPAVENFEGELLMALSVLVQEAGCAGAHTKYERNAHIAHGYWFGLLRDVSDEDPERLGQVADLDFCRARANFGRAMMLAPEIMDPKSSFASSTSTPQSRRSRRRWAPAVFRGCNFPLLHAVH